VEAGRAKTTSFAPLLLLAWLIAYRSVPNVFVSPASVT
jgi:hypothetical protein